MNKEKKDQLLEEANEAVAAISGCCDGLSTMDDDEYINTIEENANKLLKIAKELAEA